MCSFNYGTRSHSPIKGGEKEPRRTIFCLHAADCFPTLAKEGSAALSLVLHRNEQVAKPSRSFCFYTLPSRPPWVVVGENDAVIGLVDVDPNIDDEKEDEAKWRDICIGIASLCLLFLFWRCDVR
ncbi:hypothetical protein GW17_00030324 [Ensete ventricosum]|nr:hypothetical protein GW17_00030324 [Ensete ventricosum]